MINFDSQILGPDNKPLKNGLPQFEFLLNENGEVVYYTNGDPVCKITPDGAPIVKKEAPDMILRDVCLAALNASFKDDRQFTDQEQVARFVLAVKLVNGGEQELKFDELSLLKERVRKAYSDKYVILVRAIQLLDPSDKILDGLN